MEVLIVLGTMYNGNLGIGALTTSAISLLEGISSELGIEFHYTLFGTNRSQACRDILKIGAKEIPYAFVPFAKTISIREFPFADYRRLVKRMDVVIDLGFGDGFTDIYGFKRFWSIVVMAKIVPLLGKKPMIMMPQTIGPFKSRWRKALADAILKRIDVIYPRDGQSRKYLEEHVKRGPYKEVVDIAFALPIDRVPGGRRTEKVGINVSGLLWHGGYTRDNMFSLTADYQRAIGEILRFFGSQNVDVTLVPHVLVDKDNVEDDCSVNESLKKQFGFVSIAPRFNSAIEAKTFIGGLDFFVGSRMHSCIAAFSAGVPVVPIAYSRKFTGLFTDTLQYDAVANAVASDTSEIVRTVTSAFANRNELRKIIHARATMVEESLRFLKNDLARQLRIWFPSAK